MFGFGSRRKAFARRQAIKTAESMRNFTYYWSDGTKPQAGGDDPIFGFNCSGLASEICRSVGWIGPYERLSSFEFLKRFSKSVVPKSPRSGDFIIFGQRNGNTLDVYHIAFMVDQYHFIEAGGGGRGTDTPGEAADKNAFVRVRPIEFRQDEQIAILRVWK